MRTSLHFPIAPGRTTGAWVCLLAVVLLWAPMYAAAWQTQGMACCGGGFCAAHEHPKPSQSHRRQAMAREASTNCEHHGKGGFIACSMSCCHESGSSLTTAVIFLLPPTAIVSQPAAALASPVSFAPMAFVQSFDPPSPPPRTPLFSL